MQLIILRCSLENIVFRTSYVLGHRNGRNRRAHLRRSADWWRTAMAAADHVRGVFLQFGAPLLFPSFPLSPFLFVFSPRLLCPHPSVLIISLLPIQPPASAALCRPWAQKIAEACSFFMKLPRHAQVLVPKELQNWVVQCSDRLGVPICEDKWNDI